MCFLNLKWYCVVLLQLSAIIIASSNAGEVDVELVAEAIPKLTKLKSYLHNTEIKGVVTTEYASKSKVLDSTKTVFRYLSAQNSELIETKLDSGLDEMKVVGFNPTYAMILTGQKGLTNYRLDHLSGKAKKREVFVESMDANLTKYLLSVYGWSREQPYSELLKDDPCFVIKKLSKTSQDANELLSVDFDYKATESRKNIVLGGWLQFDVKQSYALKNSRLNLKGGGKSECSIEYSVDSVNRVQPVKIVWKITGGGDRKDEVLLETLQIESWKSITPDSKDFMLTGYGLPEILSVESARSQGSRWYLLLIGLLLIFMGYLIKYQFGKNHKS